MSIEEIEKLADEAIEELEGSRRPAILSAMKKLDRIRHLAGRMIRIEKGGDWTGDEKEKVE